MLAPQQLDPKGIADSVVRNNMGVEAIELGVRGRIVDGVLRVADTGQVFPVEGGPATSAAPWLVFDVRGFEPDAPLTLRFRAEVQAPRLGAAGLVLR